MHEITHYVFHIQGVFVEEVGRVEVSVTEELGFRTGFCGWVHDDTVHDEADDGDSELTCGPAVATGLKGEVERFLVFSTATGRRLVVDDEEGVRVGEDAVDTAREDDVDVADGEGFFRWIVNTSND